LLAAMWPLTVIAPLMRLTNYCGRIVVSEHNNLTVQYGKWGKIHRGTLRSSMAVSYRLADARVAVSSGVADDIARLSCVKRNRFNVIYNPVPPRGTPDDATLTQIEAVWNVSPGARIVTVGSLKAQKNHSLLLQSCARLDHPKARLMILGKGSGETTLRKLAADLGIAERVIFAGFHPDPTPFYQTADLFVLSSDYEGFGNVIVEALACGTPVISTDCPSGPAEILDDGKYGRLVPPRDPDSLAEAMQKALLASHDHALLMHRAGQFAPVSAAKQYLDLLGS